MVQRTLPIHHRTARTSILLHALVLVQYLHFIAHALLLQSKLIYPVGSLVAQYKDKIFFLPHTLGFRGRCYPTPPHFQHMGIRPVHRTVNSVLYTVMLSNFVEHIILYSTVHTGTCKFIIYAFDLVALRWRSFAWNAAVCSGEAARGARPLLAKGASRQPLRQSQEVSVRRAVGNLLSHSLAQPMSLT